MSERITASPVAEVSIDFGNCWLILATMAKELLQCVGSAAVPWVIFVSPNGDLSAVDADHEQYEARLKAPGFVCTASESMPLERLAGRIRDAVIAAQTPQ